MSPDGNTAPRPVAAPAAPITKLADIFAQGTRLLSRKEGSFRIGVIGSVTTDLLARAIALGASQEGVDAVLYQAGFGTWLQEALDPNSELHRFSAAAIVIATDWRDVVSPLPLSMPNSQVEEAVKQRLQSFRMAWDTILQRSPNCRIIQHLPIAAIDTPGGVADLRCPASMRGQLDLARQQLLQLGPDIIFLDLEGLPPDLVAWYGAKLPFAQDGLIEYLLRFRSALRQCTSRVKKVLALDLDNTLWGGVIGDDGMEGIVLGSETPRGEAFAAFQQYAKDLSERGVILAVCSKNDPEIATSGFSHPAAVLKRADFQAFECNWTDKASALSRIARTLNVGVDSIVFADDNPVECALVRAALPDVTVIELGEDPALFTGIVSRGRWFETQQIGLDDLKRRDSYAAREQAATAQEQAPDLESFLRSLEMTGRVFIGKGRDLARIAQLESKTNQFNLTLRRHALTAIERFAADDDAVVFGATLADRFGEHGLVSSVVGIVEQDDLVIDSWLMSCRVFARTLEQFVMRHLLEHARTRGLKQIVGLYVPGPKNDIVADLYSRLGFVADGDGRWTRRVSSSRDELTTFVLAAE